MVSAERPKPPSPVGVVVMAVTGIGAEAHDLLGGHLGDRSSFGAASTLVEVQDFPLSGDDAVLKGMAEMLGQSCYEVRDVEHGRALMERAMDQACRVFGRDKLQTLHIVVQLQVSDRKRG